MSKEMIPSENLSERPAGKELSFDTNGEALRKTETPAKKAPASQLKGSLILFCASLIWGTAFVAQSIGAEYVGGLTFSSIRSFIGAIFLIPVAIIVEKISHRKDAKVSALPEDRTQSSKSSRNSESSLSSKRSENSESSLSYKIGPVTKAELKGGLISGTALAAATIFQQFGIGNTTVAKAGFLTALYVILVPILGLFLGRKVRPYIWFCAILSLTGLYFLCLAGKSGVGFTPGDIQVLICAFLFAIQILTIDYWSMRCRGVVLSCLMFFVVAIESGILMLIFEHPTLSGILAAGPSLLYVGVFSSGIAYTLQIIGQRNLNPALASLLMCLESVISAISGWIILGQAMTGREIFGGSLMFLSIVLAQVLPILRKPSRS
ncbi:DMT family transporter [Lachnospiraceae bacterium YH-ros2228]